MKGLWFVVVFSLVSPNLFATTYIVKEGDREVGRWTEDDGMDAIHEIQEEKPKA